MSGICCRGHRVKTVFSLCPLRLIFIKYLINRFVLTENDEN